MSHVIHTKLHNWRRVARRAGWGAVIINPLSWGLAVVLLAAVFNMLRLAQAKTADRVLGGPTNSNEAYLLSQEVVYAESVPHPAGKDREKKNAGHQLVDKVGTIADDNPLKPYLARAGNVFIYTIQSEDTVEKIATRFGITPATIRQANKMTGDRLTAGRTIIVPPVTGVIHELAAGETPEMVAYDYQAETERIRDVNTIIAPGVKIVVPEGIPPDGGVRITGYRLPNLKGYFNQPTIGVNWGSLHQNNAVDIANTCSTIITAAADGVVTQEQGEGWNGGYGNYLIIEHPNGTKTLYAHTSENLRMVGDVVKQGEEIAKMGNTGNVDGATGCHLHFEVHGAVNPFAN